mmetsp:Transcript_27548/g.42418  ORF Transcript_27548/g.42418 Transcript_27548/m.42418 type:complete len:88 (-) Transcript_27548:6-269(-)
MVIYRNKAFLDSTFETTKPREEFIPEFLREEIDKLNQAFRKEKDEYEERKSLIHLQFLYPTESEKSEKSHLISIPKHKTLQEATVSQ